ncbi:sulfate transporter [Amylibacter ulvae]|uniref:Sulfate transporter n=1 Tax=Paramylibacter ulvae TaxID=1651968 RepID=A0ABQ3D158_9RHOB|nr:SulP family inorganic anion transporter [Amylibacter ulvae]GHA51651.1 sulfate transporter [Amylibacter ulvae]
MRYPDPFPARQWLGQVTGTTLRADAFAGFTNAAIVLPQGVAFATIAGLPAEYGLYTAMITAVVAAMFGSSMVMISGPTTAISAVLFATLSDMAAPGSAHYIELALMMTILVGLFQIAGGIGRLGGLISFVSHSVMTAFTAAAALLIAVSQLAGAFGVHVERGGNVVERIYRLFENIGTINHYAVLISLGTLAIAILSQKIAPKLPGFLIALLAGSFGAYALDAASHGVHMIGALPAIVPSLKPPTSAIGDIGVLAPGAAAIALVGLLEAISIGRAFAVRRKENFDANQEMIGQGMSNFIGGFFQCYAGSGSFTRSGVNATAGAMTPMSGVFASVFLLLILLFTAQLVAFIPTPAMAGLILFVAWKLIDVHEIKHIIETKSAETVILLLTLGAGLLIELDFAIYVGVIASLAVFVYESARPDLTITAPMVAANGDRKFRDAVKNDLEQCPQLVSLSIDGPLYFGSVEHVEKRLKRIRRRNPRQINMVLYLKGGGKVDLAGADLLISVIREVRSVGGSFRIVANVQTLIDSLERLHVIDELGPQKLFHSKGEAVADATRDFNLRVCKACIRDVFRECDRLRDTELETDR